MYSVIQFKIHPLLLLNYIFPLVFLLSYSPNGNAQSEVQSGIAAVNGTTLYYEMAGSGHPLVLIHGGAVDSRAFDDQFEVFAQHYKVIRYDVRGAGRSGDRDKPFSNMEDLRALLNHLDIESAYLLGISRGGGFAMDLTLEHPDRVDALILVSSNLGVHVPAYTEMFERATQAGKESGAAAAAAVWGNDPHQGPQRESARPKVLEIITDNMPRFRYFNGYEPVARLPDYEGPRYERLHEIQAPTLVISGAYDNEVARANSRNWAEGIETAKLVLFPNSGHLVNIDEVEAFNRTVLDFLNSL
jgi:pimeloyl-ACP methyl ester carboxylesterase